MRIAVKLEWRKGNYKMRFKRHIKRLAENPYHIFCMLAYKGAFHWLPDETYLKWMFKGRFGKWPDLEAPKTFNEKLQWLKLYDRKPEYTKMVDKYEVKQYVAERIGEEYIIPTLGVWDSFDEIDFDTLPDQFVLKCTHDSGGLVICRDKSKLDKAAAKSKIEHCLKRDFYACSREWPYKDVKPRIIAEAYMEDTATGELRDYKFFCFNGEVKCFKIDFDRFIKHRANYYSPEGDLLPFGESAYPPDVNKILPMPHSLKEMIDFAQKLSANIPFLRVDFYEVGKQIYFGELTFYPAAGFGFFTSEEWDLKLGEWIQLPDQ